MLDFFSMSFSSNKIFSQSVPLEIFLQLRCLWEEMEQAVKGSKLLTEEDLVTEKESIVRPQKIKFSLLLSKNFCVLLWGENLAYNADTYRIKITLNKLEIINIINAYFSCDIKKLGYKPYLDAQVSNSTMQNYFIVKMLNIINSQLSLPNQVDAPSHNKLLPAIEQINYQKIQQKLLTKISQQITQNSDDLSTIEKNLDKVVEILNLERKSLEAQLELRTKQLEDALLAAQAARQSKQEFIDHISHELRTPLTCIIGLAGTLLHWSAIGNDKVIALEKQKQYLETIQESGRNLLTSINNILEYSQIKAGESLLNLSYFSCRSFCRKIWHSIQSEAKNKGIKIDLLYDLSNTEDYLWADRERLEKIILNLLNNAIKYTPTAGKVTLEVKQQNQQILFTVADSGIGIAQEQIPHLFEQFHQLEKPRSRVYGGTGLSLALSKKLIELHGGTITVESQLGKGSIFTISLPQNQVKKLQTLPERKDDLKQIIRPQHIVLISEEEELATMLCQLLTAANYQVVWLLESEIISSKINLLNPKILIVEQKLLEKRGIDIKEYIARIPNTKVILLTTKIPEKQKRSLAKIGVTDYFLKPVDINNLVYKITHLCSEEKNGIAD